MLGVVLPIEEQPVAQQFRAVWRMLAARGISVEQEYLGGSPHVALFGGAHEMPSQETLGQIVDVVHQQKPFSLCFDALTVMKRTLPGGRVHYVVLARPDRSETINNLQSALFNLWPSDRSYDRPDIWQGHTTFARDVAPQHLGEAMGAIGQIWNKAECLFTRVAIVDFSTRPPQEKHSITLGKLAS